MSTLLSLLAGIVITSVLIALNGFYVAQEFAFMSADRAELRTRADAGDERAQSALRLTQRTSFLLSGAQVGITVTGLLIGVAAEPLIGTAFGDLLDDTALSPDTAVAIGTILALAISTIVQMLFGELFPKNYTLANPMNSALALAKPSEANLWAFGWFITFFDWTAESFIKLLGIDPVDDVDASASREDLEAVIEDSRESGDLDDRTYMVLDRMLDFPDQDVDHAMIPRSRVDVLEPDQTVAEARQEMHQSHTRFPVIDDEHNPVGTVHVLDVLDPDLDPQTPVSEIMCEPVIVHELMSLPDAVSSLREADEKIACVIDEYGGFVGIISMEDLGEEVLGDITDEHEQSDTEEITALGEDTWIADGDTPVDEVIRAVGYELPDGDYETLSGLLLSEAGDLIEPGETIVVDLEALPEDFVDGDEVPERHLQAEVLEVERNVPSEIRLTLIDPDDEEDEK